MNSISKRKNPFDVPLRGDEEEKIQPIYNEEAKPAPKIVQETTKPVYAPQQKPIYRQTEQAIAPLRDKYTATMDRKLRRKIKVACATNGIMFSEFVEIACQEKLKREGLD